mmetsp:Transcript_42472/g.51521  ORF Transcript_42472/g.51521 Transcript_42472/m.51521 type:complete len:375 (+) Transcript_42472:198-1322(+)
MSPTMVAQNNGSNILEYTNMFIDTWNFDALEVAKLTGGRPLAAVARELFHRYELATEFDIPQDTLNLFLETVEHQYALANPYHCPAHAADVLVNSHYLLQGGIKSVCTPVEVLSLFVAAVGHDVGHFSLNNDFLRNSRHEYALRDNTSPLETYHIRTILEILQEPKTDILCSLPEEKKELIKSLVCDLIIATDMGRHKGYVSRFNEWASRAASSNDSGAGEKYSAEGREPIALSSENVSEDERRLLLVMTLKCADLANVVKPLHIADAWAVRIMEEFYRQGEKELALNLPLTTFHSREHAEYKLAKHQLAFVEAVVAPLFRSYSGILAQEYRSAILTDCENNIEQWRKRKDDLCPEQDKASAQGSIPSRNGQEV